MANSHTAKLLLALGLYSMGCTAQGAPASTSVTNTGNGGVAVGENKGTINIGIDAEQLRKMLDERDRKIAKELRDADPKNKQRIRQLEAEKKDLEYKLANFEETLKEYRAKLAEQAKELESLRGSVSDESLNKAQQALARGDTQAADQLLAEYTDNIESRRAAEDVKLAQAYYQRGQFAELRIDYMKAFDYYAEAVQIQNKDQTYLIPAGKMALVLGRYEQAERFYLDALEVGEKTFGNSHPLVAIALDNLAGVYQTQGQYTKAEPMLLRALEIEEMTLGKEAFDVGITLNNLALLYEAQGQYTKAEQMYLRSLKIKEKTFRTNPVNVAITLSNLAKLYAVQSQYAKAEPLYLYALKIYGKVLDKDHPQVATSLNNLARSYSAQGQYARAEPLYLRAIKIAETRLGSDHPDTKIMHENFEAMKLARKAANP